MPSLRVVQKTNYSNTVDRAVLIRRRVSEWTDTARLKPTFRPSKCHNQNKPRLNIANSTLEPQTRETAVFSDDYHPDLGSALGPRE